MNPLVQSRPRDEDELQRELALLFRSNGWTAVREYSPDHANVRVDLLADHDAYGRIGVETKFLTTARSGGTLAEAHMQITRDYWHRQYNGEQITLWAIAPYYHGETLPGSVDERRVQSFVREFCHRQGIGVIDCHANTLTATFANGTIPIAGPYLDTYDAKLDVESLRKSVQQKRGERN